MPMPSEIDWRKPVLLIDRPGVPEQYHLFDDESKLAIRAALGARRPLLVRGEPGVGKTQLAAAAARVLHRPLLPKVVDSRTESRDLLWEFDAIMRLADAQIAGALSSGSEQKKEELQRLLAVGNYVRPGPLWWAFDWDNALIQATRSNSPVPPIDPGADPANGCVVLIDEIDKADSDVPNGLLEALGSGRFTPLGQTNPVTVRDDARPLVVITTNEERVLPNAFVRRCLVLELKLDDDHQKLVDRLVTRAEAHFPRRAEASKPLFVEAAKLLVADRQTAIEGNMSPLPGQAEYLDLLRAVFDLEADSLDAQSKILESVSRYAVRKHSEARP